MVCLQIVHQEKALTQSQLQELDQQKLLLAEENAKLAEFTSALKDDLDVRHTYNIPLFPLTMFPLVLFPLLSSSSLTFSLSLSVPLSLFLSLSTFLLPPLSLPCTVYTVQRCYSIGIHTGMEGTLCMQYVCLSSGCSCESALGQGYEFVMIPRACSVCS